MKILIKERNIALDTRVLQTMVCRAGTAYWRVEYIYAGSVILGVTSGAIWGQPSPIAALDWDNNGVTTKQRLLSALDMLVVDQRNEPY